MAKAAWCIVSPMEGKENGTINISAAAHTGRIARNTTVVVTAKNGTNPSANITVSQIGAAVTTTMEASKPDAMPGVEIITINGTSNSSKLRWFITGIIYGNDINLSPSMVKIAAEVNNTPIDDNAAIVGDPGAIGQYDFVVTLDIRSFKMPFDIPTTFEITDDSGTTKTCVFVRKASASILNVDKSSLALDGSGTVQGVAVTSNDEWTVS